MKTLTEREAFEVWWPSVGQTIGKVAAWEAWKARADSDKQLNAMRTDLLCIADLIGVPRELANPHTVADRVAALVSERDALAAELVVLRDAKGDGLSMYAMLKVKYANLEHDHNMLAAELNARPEDDDARDAAIARLSAALKPFANYACEESCDCHNCEARAAILAAKEQP
jgi:hypothetical protein